MSWTQPICDDCWTQEHPDRDPARMLAEKCCKCGNRTNSGIFIRVDPKTVAFPREDEVERLRAAHAHVLAAAFRRGQEEMREAAASLVETPRTSVRRIELARAIRALPLREPR